MSESYASPRKRPAGRAPSAPGTPAQARELRAQGRKTMRKLLDAGMRVFGERGFHAARVDDIVRAARTSHGTFYLYFANKEDLLRALAVECARELDAVAGELGPVSPDAVGEQELRRFLAAFFTTYRRYGPVIRAWMEGHVSDPEATSLGLHAFTDIATALAARMGEVGVPSDRTTIAACMAMLERAVYYFVSRRIDIDTDEMLDTITRMVHRGFFGAPVSV
jgi:AcrR family transcriptional regulator